MKFSKSLTLVPIVAVLAACSSAPKEQYERRAYEERERQEKLVDRAIDKAPKWMSELPKSTSAVYANGSAVSNDMSFADAKAKAVAYSKICMAAGGTVNSQTKIFRQDGNDSANELSEMAIKAACPNVDITGAETVEIKRVAEGTRFRTYALVALPIGDANGLRKEKSRERDRTRAQQRAPEAFKELDRNKPIE